MVTFVDWYGPRQGWNYGVIFHANGGVWVNVDESDLLADPGNFEWVEGA